MTPMSEDELWDALDGIHAYDSGSIDSGIHDEALRDRVRSQMRAMAPDDRRLFISRRVRDTYLSEDALSLSYGLEDAAEFWRWLDEEMGCAV